MWLHIIRNPRWLPFFRWPPNITPIATIKEGINIGATLLITRTSSRIVYCDSGNDQKPDFLLQESSYWTHIHGITGNGYYLVDLIPRCSGNNGLKCNEELIKLSKYKIQLLLRQYHRRSSSVARQIQGIKQSRNRKTTRETSMDEDARKQRRIGSIIEIRFRRRRNETILRSDLTLAGSELHTVGAAAETARSRCRLHAMKTWICCMF